MMLRVAAFIVPVVVMCTSLSHAAQAPVEPGFDTTPQISPNGSWLLFERLYGGSRYSPPDTSLRIARADGAGERELVSRTRYLTALWTPENLVEVILPQQDGTVQVTLRRPEDGTVVRQLPVAPAAWSPDGNWIAYVDGRTLYVARPDGSQARALVTAPELGWIGVGEFSPESTRLTYVVGLPDARDRSEVVRIDGTDRHVLRQAPVVSPGKWSPDGTSLVFMAQNDSGRYRPPRVYVIGGDGANAHAIAPGFATSPDWSPHGDWIAYLRQTPTRTQDLYDIMIVRPNGTERRRVVRTDGAGGSWLADGRHLLSIGSGACRRWGVLEIDAFARTVKRLTNRCRIDGTPRADNLRGTPLRDLIDGRGGADKIVAGGGNDLISGGPGNDTIVSKDHYRDTVRCGPGRDRVVADYRDRIDRACELVRR
jgi:RTX calcium-binding nonapeptide repeat (4 copies)/WD40-like Beta Propeller Repeat